jgi:NAD(P)-dependent dehydrogenase (short-subunit alcohol dehydrogenase family)
MRCDSSGKGSLVAGAARGIGQAIADRLASNGSRVVYTDVDAEGADLAAARTDGAMALAPDVTRLDEICSVIERIAGLVPLRLQCAYVVAKAGVVNLTRAVASRSSSS